MTNAGDGQPRGGARRGWVVSIGTELTLGLSVDTNAAWLASQLAAVGIRCERHVTVADQTRSISEVLRQAATSTDVIVVSGGLGPTADDVTREALAAAAGTELELDAASLEQIRAFFAQRAREMPEGNRVQARIPRSGRAIPNTCGTAPGVRIELNGVPCYALPGVPYEMERMFTRDVLPELRALSAGSVLRARCLRCFGLSEVEIGERLRDRMRPDRNPTVGTTAELGVIGVRINAVGATSAAAAALLDETEAQVRARLGDVVFGRDEATLAAAVGAQLAARGETLAVAESCTGGLIAKMLTDVPGSSGYFVGGAVTYSNELKQRLLGVPAAMLASAGAVSAVVAGAMARGARQAFGSTYALAVTGIAGPSGGTPDKPVGLVFLGLATPDEEIVREARLGSDSGRAVIRARAALTALSLLRAHLLR